MSADVIMPALGVAQETGKLLSWHKREGDTVTKGEALMEIETDKITVAIEAPASGVLTRVAAKSGDEIPVGQVMAIIQTPDDEPKGAAIATLTTMATPTNGATTPAGVPSPVGASVTPVAARLAAGHHLDLSLVAPSGDRIRKDDVLAHMAARQSAIAPHHGTLQPASPKARRLAAERGIDLATLQGTGPHGAVLATDVLLAAMPTSAPSIPVAAPVSANDAPPTTATADEGDTSLVQLSGLGRLMARRTTESFRDTPHFYLTRELMAAALLAARERLLPLIEARAGVRLSFTDLLIRVLAQALSEHPMLNASWHDGAIKLHQGVHLGVAAATPQGLLVPVMHDAVGKNLAQIARDRTDLAARAVSGRLTPNDLAGGTATLSNLGMYGVDMFQAIINPPQSMILAVGRVAERPVARDGAVVAAHTFWVTASFDHRFHDGARAAEFLRTFASYVEEPLGLL